MPVNPFREIERMEERLKWRKESLLASRGWKSTSQVPGSYWMHEKKMPDGRVMIVTTDLALRIEEYL
jgi:hypothetical protein